MKKTFGIILNFPQDGLHVCNHCCNECLLRGLNFNFNLKPELQAIKDWLAKDIFEEKSITLYILSNLTNIDINYITQLSTLGVPLNLILCNDLSIQENESLLAKFTKIYILQNNYNIKFDNLNYISLTNANALNTLFLLNNELYTFSALEEQLLLLLHINLWFMAKPKFIAEDGNFKKYIIPYYKHTTSINSELHKKYSLIYIYYKNNNLLETPQKLYLEERLNINDEKFIKY